MSSVDQLLSRFVAECCKNGDADPLLYLQQVSGADRAELTALIDGFLAQAPPPAFEQSSFAAFAADSRRQALVKDILTDDESLLDVRAATGMSKAAVGARLAEALGLLGQEAGAKACYHEIETGQVEPRRVRPAVWEALGELFDTTTARLRSAVNQAFELRGPLSAEAFARSTEEGPAPARRRDSGVTSAGADKEVRRVFFMDPGEPG